MIVNFIYKVKWLYLLKRNYVLLQFSHCFKAYILSLYYQHSFYVVAFNNMYSFFSRLVYACMEGMLCLHVSLGLIVGNMHNSCREDANNLQSSVQYRQLQISIVFTERPYERRGSV